MSCIKRVNSMDRMPPHPFCGIRGEALDTAASLPGSFKQMICVLSTVAACFSGAAWAQSSEDLARLSIEELGDLEVTSVFKRPEPLGRTPAAVYVITQEEIRRSGAVSLAEALRLAPNLQVARENAASYAISARGFNSISAANKLLVMIDGRSIYTPLHAGVFWDQQQILLHDIDRIEVVSGPGGTLWGANAVNGVINIITRSAWHTDGTVVTGRAGTLDQSLSARYSGRMGEGGAYRIYGMGFERGESLQSDGRDANDEWSGLQAGGRADWQREDDAFTVQGEVFENSIEGGNIEGLNVLSRWSRQISATSAFEVQAYYDTVERQATQVVDSLETFDLELQHSFAVNDTHQLVWGAGHRMTQDEFINELNIFVVAPETDTVQLSNIFAQDSVVLGPHTTLTVGTKLEYSSYTGLEVLPSARLGWQLSPNSLLWTAISRAVRTPARLDRDLMAPGVLEAAKQFDSEVLVAYEAGVRVQPREDVSVAISLFYNDYEKLRMLTVSQSSGLFLQDNAMEGYTYGAELWGDYQVQSWWRISAGINLLEKQLKLSPNAMELVLHQHAGNDPEHQLFLRSSMNLPRNVELDITFRAIDDLPNPAVPSYEALDLRLGWRLSDSLDLSLAGFNLLDEEHSETGVLPARRDLRRSAHIEAQWRF